MSNSIAPNETAHYEPSHLDLCRLQKPIIIACGSERVKRLSEISVRSANPTDNSRNVVQRVRFHIKQRKPCSDCAYPQTKMKTIFSLCLDKS